MWGIGRFRLVTSVEGQWIAASRELCMTGCSVYTPSGISRRASNFSVFPASVHEDQRDCEVGVRLRYPEHRSLATPFVTGEVLSLREENDPRFFEPIRITALSDAEYKYSEQDGACIPDEQDVPPGIDVFKHFSAVCQYPFVSQMLQVFWSRDCHHQNCTPFNNTGKSITPDSRASLGIQNLECDDDQGKIHALLIFVLSQGNDTRSDMIPAQRNLVQIPADGNWDSRYKMLAAEGSWDSKAGQVCMVGHYFSTSEYTPRDANIRITFQLPRTQNLFFQSSLIGHVKSTRSASSDIRWFHQFSFKGNMLNAYPMHDPSGNLTALEYAYTVEKIDQAERECKEDVLSTQQLGKASYPSGSHIRDLQMHVKLRKNSRSNTSWCFFRLKAINNQFMERFEQQNNFNWTIRGEMNVSFDLEFGASFPALSAEGIYRPGTGKLCLVACIRDEQTKPDCSIFVTGQYSSMGSRDANGKKSFKGKMMSLKTANDSLYFEPVTLSSMSMFAEEALQSIWTMDIEIVMSMASLSMAAIFIGLQLGHVRRHPSSLQNLSMLMLLVLNVGYMIPLVVNFEATFSQTSRGGGILLGSRELLGVEILMRLLYMSVFLLLLRLLQQAWVRKREMVPEGPWSMEKKVLFLCLPPYILSGLAAFISHWRRATGELQASSTTLEAVPASVTFQSIEPISLAKLWPAHMKPSIWSDMKAYAGLVLDLFLLPQIVANFAWNINQSVLCHSFYLGMTLVRSLPHIYDGLRALNVIPLGITAYFYASPNLDYYSHAWDIIIPSVGFFMAALIFFQQRYGAAGLIPSHWRERFQYEKVSTRGGGI